MDISERLRAIAARSVKVRNNCLAFCSQGCETACDECFVEQLWDALGLPVRPYDSGFPQILGHVVVRVRPEQAPMWACAGCKDYVGSNNPHGGDRLVCGIHPYGWKGEEACPDKRVQISGMDASNSQDLSAPT
jgi:hypothetical protein